ncbi:MAG: DUF444 family protein, partial [Bdellovibrionota bacterium]
NERAVAAGKELCKMCNLFGYGEIKPSGSAYYSGSMLDVFKQIDEDNFHAVVIERKEDLWPAFKSLLTKDKKSEQSLKAEEPQAKEAINAKP